MEKKNLKWYEAPAVEIIELETTGSMLVSSNEESEEGDFPDF